MENSRFVGRCVRNIKTSATGDYGMTAESVWSAWGGLFSLVVVLIAAIYPYLALGRIWLYSKQQVELLREIRAALEKTGKGER